MEGLNKILETNYDSRAVSLLKMFVFLFPLFFIPSYLFPVGISKTILVLVTVTACMFFWLMSSWRDKQLVLPGGKILLAGLIVSIVYIISAFSSKFIKGSFVGYGLDIGTFMSVFMAFILMLFFSIYMQKRDSIKNFYPIFVWSFFVLSFFQIIRLIWGPDVLSFGIFTNATSNLFGRWNELAIFFGMTSVLSLGVLEYANKRNTQRVIAMIMLFISIFFLLVVNFPMVWYALFAFTLVFLARSYLSKRSLMIPIIVMAVSLFSITFNDLILKSVTNFFNVPYAEVNPSLLTTLDIAKNVLKDNPIFGAGPNQFSQQWSMYKPMEINNTAFWNYGFNSGFGFIPSSFVNVGVLGFISWLLFIVAFIFYGARSLIEIKNSQEKSIDDNIFSVVFFIVAYLWLFLILYTPSSAIFFLTFSFMGLFVALLTNRGIIKNKTISLSEKKDKPLFLSIFIFSIVISVGVALFSLKNVISYVYYQKALRNLNSGNVDMAGKDIVNALMFDNNDPYYRLYSTINVVKMKNLLARRDLPEDEMRNRFENIFKDCVDNAKNAVDMNSSDYQNWMALGWVYESITPFGINGAYDSAKEAYGNALALAPNDPSISFSMARLEVANKNIEGAKNYLVESINKKRNYKEAYSTMAQIQISENDINGAINTMITAVQSLPNDYEILYQLGVLEYSVRNYNEAILVLEKTVSLNTNYSNARYFLGLSYIKTNQMDKALVQFEALEKLNPDNKEVKNILAGLRSR